MALIIDRQSSALKAMEWNKDSIERAAKLDEDLFTELQAMAAESKATGTPEGTLDATAGPNP